MSDFVPFEGERSMVFVDYSALGVVYQRDNPAHFKEAIESVFNQTLKPKEVVLVINGPIPEEVEQVIRSFRKNQKIVEIRLKKNMGLGLALQEGLLVCKNDLVMRFDADDINRSDRAELQILEFQRRPELSVVSAHIEEFFEKPGDAGIIRRCFTGDPEICKNAFVWRNGVNHVATMFKKSAVLKAGGYLHRLELEDYYLWLRLLASGAKITGLDTVCVDVRVGSGMFGRRQGWRYVRVEFDLLKLKNHFLVGSPASRVVSFILRALPRLLPQIFLRKLYLFSRSRVKEKPVRLK